MVMRRSHFKLNQDNIVLVKPERAKRSFAVDGQFSLDKSNNLIYLLNEPSAWRREYELPNRLRFKGKWKLNPNHDLVLHLDKTEQQFKGDYLRLYGKILCAGTERLVFQIKSRNKRGVNRFSLLRLSGSWQADKYNRIIFQVRKKVNPDTLIFRGVWQVNNKQQIVYEYEKTKFKTKRKIKNTLSFTGFWQISSVNRLRYILSKSSHSRFDFRVQLETPNVYPKKGAVKYRLGIGARENSQSPRIRIITLYGTWRFSRKLGLCFEMEYDRGRLRQQIFDAEVNLNKSDRIIFKLIDKQGRRLGISVVFHHRFLSNQDAQWFLRLKKGLKDKKIDTGVRIAF